MNELLKKKYSIAIIEDGENENMVNLKAYGITENGTPLAIAINVSVEKFDEMNAEAYIGMCNKMLESLGKSMGSRVVGISVSEYIKRSKEEV